MLYLVGFHSFRAFSTTSSVYRTKPTPSNPATCMVLFSVSGQSSSLILNSMNKTSDTRFRKRYAIISCYKDHRITTIDGIAKKLKLPRSTVAFRLKRFKETGVVHDKPGRGRKRLLTGEKLAKTLELITDTRYGSSTRVANALNLAYPQSKRVSPRTVRRRVREAGFRFRSRRAIPYITAMQAQKRLKFCLAHRDTDWKRIAMSDSKIFQLHSPTGRQWQRAGESNGEPTPKHSDKVHVYGAVTYKGKSNLVFVTGTTGKRSKYINPKTNQLHTGVQAREYQDVVKDDLVPSLKCLYHGTPYAHNWRFQQDGAPAHTAKGSKRLVNQLAPGGLLENWPPNSPDLNWIENVWAWMEGELRKRPVCRDVEHLKEVLLDIWDAVPDSMLQNCVNSMRHRMEQVIELNGGYTGH